MAPAQTGVDWLLTPDGRPGWAYNFLDMGYVVYLQDGPARGRSQYVPGVDGTAGNLNLTISRRRRSRRRFTAGATRGGFPAAKKHTQWPGSGPDRRQGIRRLRTDTGAVPRRHAPGGADARRERRTARRNRHVRSFSSRTRRAARSDGQSPNARPNQVKAIVARRARWSAAQRHRQREGDVSRITSGHRRPSVGHHEHRARVRAGGRRAVGTSDRVRRAESQPGRVGVLPAEGAGAKAEEPPEHSRARADGGSQLSRCLRSLHGAVADAGRREDRARRAREGRHVGQRAHDDAREEQRRHRQVHRRLALEKCARGVGRERVEGDARQSDPDVLDREHRAQRICVRRRQLLGCAGSAGDARRDVHRGVGAAPGALAVPGHLLPRQRADRRAVAADAGRSRRLGVSPGRAGLRGLHGRLPRARTIGLRAAART